jgi:cbb3-type cytochrome oxidase maturation protein
MKMGFIWRGMDLYFCQNLACHSASISTCEKVLFMQIIILLIFLSLIIAVGFLAAFFWAVKSGQFDDDYTPSIRILFDDDPVKISKDKTKN